MSRIFREILVTVAPAPDAYELRDCMAELKSIYEEQGDNHQHSVFAQVFNHSESDDKYYLTGKIITPDQGDRIRAILAE